MNADKKAWVVDWVDVSLPTNLHPIGESIPEEKSALIHVDLRFSFAFPKSDCGI
jgi:hypothetical protein